MLRWNSWLLLATERHYWYDIYLRNLTEMVIDNLRVHEHEFVTAALVLLVLLARKDTVCASCPETTPYFLLDWNRNSSLSWTFDLVLLAGNGWTLTWSDIVPSFKRVQSLITSLKNIRYDDKSKSCEEFAVLLLGQIYTRLFNGWWILGLFKMFLTLSHMSIFL